MKQVQILKTQTAIPVTITVATPSISVREFGPLTVVAQAVVTAQSSANISFQLEGSLDDSNYFSVGSAQVVTANGAYAFKDVDVAYAYYRLKYTVTGGTLTSTVTWLVYGDTI